MSDIPAALVHEAAQAAYRGMRNPSFSLDEVARAVLEAATIEIDCPAPYGEHPSTCLCGGSGSLRVLRT